MQIVNLTGDDDKILWQTAELLTDGFKDSGSNSWATIQAALDEVRESLSENRISRVAIDEDRVVLGWVGGIEDYEGHVWELYPLVVHRSYRKRGVGRALVEDFGQQVKLRGGRTIRVGTDDENYRTSLGGVDLYPDVLKHLQEIKNLGKHPYEFYQKQGYVITGVVPDANGLGKPDILMAKRID